MVSRANKEAPQRSCLGCRLTKDKESLLRFVLSPELEVLPDLDMRLPGRGAYTCVNAGCIVKAVEQRQFRRAFKQDVTVMASDDMVKHLIRQLRDKIIGMIGLANKAGKVVGGGAMVNEALRAKMKPGLVLVATDVSVAIGEKIASLAAAQHVPCRSVLSKDDFGAILGKAPRSAISVKSGGFVAQLLKAGDRYINFLGEV
jgi:predicted RNA-binding protein YlxR (DUF448 family)